ncbi:hypothetical protein [Providencia phage Kokobel2]|nr:hypothetical protein [Providencia phage Kokobel2]
MATKFDSEKAPLALIDPRFTEEIARVCATGEKKYGKANWQGLQVERLLSAVKRHILEMEKSNDIDEESGLPHAAHAASGLMFINWIIRNRPEQDDRRWGGDAVSKLRGDGAIQPKQDKEVRLDMQQMPESPVQGGERKFTAGSIGNCQRLIADWANDIFPDRTVDEAILKMNKEVGELDDSKFLDAGEFADVAILLFDIAYLAGIDIERAIENKMAINMKREWIKLEDGTRQHISAETVVAAPPMPPMPPVSPILPNTVPPSTVPIWSGHFKKPLRDIRSGDISCPYCERGFSGLNQDAQYMTHCMGIHADLKESKI